MKLGQLKYLVTENEYKAFLESGVAKRYRPDSECYLRPNGNYKILYFDDGTKVKFGEFDTMEPDMPECIDVTITDVCNGGCEYCYLNCGAIGIEHDHADLTLASIMFDELPAYTELAMNINDFSIDESHEFTDLLRDLKTNKQFVNLTVNQKHLTKENLRKLVEWKDENLIRGIGISYISPDPELLEYVNMLNTCYGDCCVIHVIAGILTKEDYDFLSNNNLNLLVLGFKEIGKGESYKATHPDLDDKITLLQILISTDYAANMGKFRSIAFDGLSIDQLHVRSWIGDKEFDQMYAGDEGSYTFYLDLVNQKYAQSSITDKKFNITDWDIYLHCRHQYSIKEMFDSIRTSGLSNKKEE